MNGKSINFEDKKINKSTFFKNKKLFNIHDLDVNKILVSHKYFIGHNDVIRPLSIKLPQMIGMLKILMIIRQCLLKLMIISY